MGDSSGDLRSRDLGSPMSHVSPSSAVAPYLFGNRPFAIARFVQRRKVDRDWYRIAYFNSRIEDFQRSVLVMDTNVFGLTRKTVDSPDSFQTWHNLSPSLHSLWEQQRRVRTERHKSDRSHAKQCHPR